MKHYHNVAISWLVIMNVFVLIIIAALLLGCDKENTKQEDADITQCIEYVTNYANAEREIVSQKSKQCLAVMEPEDCAIYKTAALEILQVQADGLIELCKSEKGIPQYD